MTVECIKEKDLPFSISQLLHKTPSTDNVPTFSNIRNNVIELNSLLFKPSVRDNIISDSKTDLDSIKLNGIEVEINDVLGQRKDTILPGFPRGKEMKSLSICDKITWDYLLFGKQITKWASLFSLLHFMNFIKLQVLRCLDFSHFLALISHCLTTWWLYIQGASHGPCYWAMQGLASSSNQTAVSSSSQSERSIWIVQRWTVVVWNFTEDSRYLAYITIY